MRLFSHHNRCRQQRHSLNPFEWARKCPSPVLPDMPDIMQAECKPRNFSQSLEVEKPGGALGPSLKQQRQDERREIISRTLNSSTKLITYGTHTKEMEAQRQQQQQLKATPQSARTRRNNFAAHRMHRTSSLTRRVQDLESALQSDKRRRSSIQLSLALGQTKGFANGSGGAGGKDGGSDASGHEAPVAVSDIIGSFGLFQMLVLLFSGLREGLVGYDALIMSVILQPETRFLCADNLAGDREYRQLVREERDELDFEQVLKLENSLYRSNLSTSTNDWNETAQCYRSADGGKTMLLDKHTHQPIQCEQWIFTNETSATGPSLVAEWSLVCQYHWLVAFVESAFFFGLVTGNLVWGYYADKVGRRPAYLAAHTISLIFGSLAVLMPSIYLFAICRFLSAFGSIGYNIIYSIQVELIGAKHRSFSTTLNHLGWGLGVISIPLVDHLFDDYRPIIALAPLLSLAM